MQCKTQICISSYTTSNIVANTIARLVQIRDASSIYIVLNLASKPLVIIYENRQTIGGK